MTKQKIEPRKTRLTTLESGEVEIVYVDKLLGESSFIYRVHDWTKAEQDDDDDIEVPSDSLHIEEDMGLPPTRPGIRIDVHVLGCDVKEIGAIDMLLDAIRDARRFLKARKKQITEE